MNNTPDNQDPVETENTEIRTPAQSPEEMDDNEPAAEGLTEIVALKIRAKTLGVTHSPNIGVDALKAKIEEHIAKLEAARSVPDEPQVMQQSTMTGRILEPERVAEAPTGNRNTLPSMHVMLKMTSGELLRFPEKRRQQIIRARMYHTEMALVRCQIFNNNPAKNDLHGEIYSVQNKYIGTIRKYIPYGEATENGYHIPRILVNMLLSKKYLQVRTIKNQNGIEQVEKRIVPEFTVRELPPLTKDELARLAAVQGARAQATSDFA